MVVPDIIPGRAALAALLVVLACGIELTPATADNARIAAASPRGPYVSEPEFSPVPGFPVRDPLVAMVRRVDHFLFENAVGGVTPDARYPLNPTEVARLTAICQLLGYAELNAVVPRDRFVETVRLCADTLLSRFAEVRSGTVFDGMLGYAMLKAYETVGDPNYLVAAEDVIAELTAISRSEYILNGGLMAAMAFAEHFRVTGNTDSEALARYVLAGEPAYQHVDGSFPHWCWCTRDISYTDWMSMELILIQRAMDDPRIDPMLAGTLAFMEGRIDEEGHTSYEGSCNAYPGCVIPYWSLGSGCGIDTETRAFTNEPAYSALLFDHFDSPRYTPVLSFLESIESGGTWADQWDYFVPPSDPYYPWASADTSVINVSINFWALAAILSGRPDPAEVEREWERDEADLTAVAPAREPRSSREPGVAGTVRDGALIAVSRMQVAPGDVVQTCDSPSEPVGLTRERTASCAITAVTPNPSPADFEVSISATTEGPTSLSIYDAAGRRVRTVLSEDLRPGNRTVAWDGRDETGRECGGGVYFAALRHGGDLQVTRLLLLR